MGTKPTRKHQEIFNRFFFLFALCGLIYYFNPSDIFKSRNNDSTYLIKRHIHHIKKVEFEKEEARHRDTGRSIEMCLDFCKKETLFSEINQSLYFRLFSLQEDFSFLDNVFIEIMKDDKVTVKEFIYVYNKLKEREEDIIRENSKPLFIVEFITNLLPEPETFEEKKNKLKG